MELRRYQKSSTKLDSNLTVMEAARHRHKRQISKKKMTDPFQVFSAENRAEVTARNPKESVGTITSMLASMWRSMTMERKLHYMEFARQFDMVQDSVRRKPRPPVEQPEKMDMMVPSIYIVRRSGTNDAIHAMSVDQLVRDMQRVP